MFNDDNNFSYYYYSNENSNGKQRHIDIPRQTQERILYEDILGYTNDEFSMQPEEDLDPMTDQNFLAFLSLLSSSEPTPPSSSTLLLQGHQPEATVSASLLNTNRKNSDKGLKRSTSGSKLGQCEHPKHVLYRQEKYTLLPSTETSSVMKTIPRRGRPPKGSKATEFLFSTSPVESGESLQIVELSVRPLPKRLEAVVGKSNIKVCLTCLKRSDLDEEYIRDKAYIGPQQIHKKKR